MPTTFADRLNTLFTEHERRTGSLLSYHEVARSTDNQLSPSYLRRLRLGKQTNPSYYAVEAIAAFFGVSLDYFAACDHPQFPRPPRYRRAYTSRCTTYQVHPDHTP